jgi:hypothetical protein
MRYLLTVDRDHENLHLALKIYNGEGLLAARSYAFTKFSRDALLPSQRLSQFGPTANEPAIPLNDDQLTFLKVATGMPNEVAVSNPVWARILHPEQYDPANFFVPSALSPILDRDDQPIVAVIPDEVIEDAQICATGGALNTEGFQALVGDSCEWIKVGNCRALRPRNPACAERYNCNRVALGAALRSFVSGGQVDLKGWSRLEAEEDLAFPALPRRYVAMLRTRALPIFLDTNQSDEIYKMLGAISDGDWSSLENGYPVFVTAPEIRDRMFGCLLRTPFNLASYYKLAPILDNPTEMFPDGLPAQAHLELRAHVEYALRPATDLGRAGYWDEDLATWLHTIRTLAFPPKSKVILPPDQERKRFAGMLDRFVAVPCTRLVIQFYAAVSPKLGFSATFKCVSNEIGPAGNYYQLPEPVRQALDEEWNRQTQVDGSVTH